jgi:hypothetical protein
MPSPLRPAPRLGLTLVLPGRDTEAAPDFDRACRLDPVWGLRLTFLVEGVCRYRPG